MIKIRIDLSLGVFEAEGDDGAVKDLYNDFKKELLSTKKSNNYKNNNEKSEESVVSNSSGVAKKVKNGAKRKESYSIVTDLNLMPSNKESLKDFYSKKNPLSGMERATVFVYYLEKIVKISGITPDHIYTCYKEIGIPVPKALKQSLLDTASRKGSIDTSNLTNITTTTVGENIVEHNLPKNKEN